MIDIDICLSSHCISWVFTKNYVNSCKKDELFDYIITLHTALYFCFFVLNNRALTILYRVCMAMKLSFMKDCELGSKMGI